MKKRLLSMILALSMMLTILPVNAITALAANDSCGANLTYTLTSNTDSPDTYTLTIRGEGAMYDYSSSYTTVPWNAQKSRITSVMIEDGVTSIGDSAFEDCSALKSVSGMKGVTSLGKWAFYKCTSLESFVIPSGVTSIPDCLFYDCSKLNSVTIHDQVTSIGSSAFFGCSILKTLSIPDSVKTIGYYAFGACNKLETINIPDGVTEIPSHAFSSCYALKKLDIPQSVTKIGDGAFDHCTSLGQDSDGTITIPANVTAIGSEAFRGCSALTSLALPQTVTSIGDTAFQGCSNLGTINIPSGVKLIDHDTFRGCEKLKDVTIPAHVTSIGDSAFETCKTFKNIKIPEGVTTIGASAFKDCAQLETVVIPSTATNIYGSAFENCPQLKSLVFPIGTTQIWGSVLSGCKNLESVTIPEGVTEIGSNAFYDCSQKLKSVKLPSTLQTIGFQAFYDCDQLSEITIPKSVTSIGQSAFGSCTNLKSVMLAKDSVPTIAKYAFSNWGGKKKIYYPDYKAGWFAQDATEKITDLKTDGVTISAGGSSMDVDICYLCDVTFDANGGTLASGAPAKTQVYRTEMVTNTKANNLTTVDDPSKPECSFIGWYTSPMPQEGEAAFSLAGTPVDPQTEDGNLTLYAVYTTAPEHATVTISGLENNATLIKGNEQQFTVTIDPKDDTGNGDLTFEFTNHETLYHQKADGSWEEVTGNTLNVGLAGGPQKFKFTPSTTGSNKLTVGVKADSNTTGIANTADVSFTVRDSIPATVTISGPTDNTVKAGEGSDVFTVAADKGDTDAAKAKFDFAGGKVQYRTGDTEEWLDLTSNELSIDDLTGKQFRVVPDTDAVTAQKTMTVKLMDASGNEIAGASDSKTFDVAARVHATVEINELNGETIKQNKAHTFTVTVTAHDDSGNATLTFDNVAGLTYNGTAVTDAGVTVTLTKNQSKTLNFTLTPDAEGAGKTLTATLNNGAKDTATYTVSEYEHAKVTIEGLGDDLKQGESKDFTVKVDPKDDSGNAIIDFGDKNSEIQYKDGEDWKPMPSGGLKINLSNGEKPHDFRITPKNDGSQTLTATVKQNDNELDEVEQTYTVAKKDEPTTPGGGSTGGSENPGENPGGGSTGGGENPGGGSTGDSGNTKPTPKPDEKSDRKIKIDGGIVEVNGKEVKPDEDGNITVKEGDEITVTVDKSKISDAQVFDQWVIKPDSVLNEVDPKSEKISFTMPAEDVTIEAMTRDASIEDDGPGILGTGTLIATGVVGSAALLYQGHMLGTELYLRYLLPHGAVIPQNRAELAVLLWQDAENPEPVSTTLYSDISEDDSAIQQAARWAVENDLMEQLDADEHPDHFDPFVPVTFSDSIRAWKKAQELKK